MAKLSEEEMLRALSELLAGDAYTWYQNEKDDWLAWTDFVEIGRRWFTAGDEIQRRLAADAQLRTQYEGESVRSFLTQIRAIVRRMTPVWTVEKQLDLYHRNVLQALVRRDEVRSRS